MTVSELIELLKDEAYDAEVYVDIKGDMHPTSYTSTAFGWDEVPNGTVIVSDWDN